MMKPLIVAGTHDSEADAVYISIGNWISSKVTTKEIKDLSNEMIQFDFDEHGHIIGIEILNAKKLIGIS